MKQLRHVTCFECGTISRLAPDENKCFYCGHDISADKEVTEREWRRYWICVLGQYPPNTGAAKKSEQRNFKNYGRST